MNGNNHRQPLPQRYDDETVCLFLGLDFYTSKENEHYYQKFFYKFHIITQKHTFGANMKVKLYVTTIKTMQKNAKQKN